MSFETIKTSTEGKVGIITFDRPRQMNALNSDVMAEVVKAARGFDADAKIGAIILTGNEKAFAAGADIKEMAELTYTDAMAQDFFAGWEAFTATSKPTIAAVSGYALGGGCEVAMMCDILLASESAKFGQPEITIGVMPGMGGSQRLTRAVGKAKAMDLILTGRMMDAEEAERAGLVARVVPDGELVETALEMASLIASFSQPSVRLAKDAVERAFEVPLSEGVRYERRLFHSLFATKDQKEGMAAFIDKRKAQFSNR
jgi:enoyl-CoA hydratase